MHSLTFIRRVCWFPNLMKITVTKSCALKRSNIKHFLDKNYNINKLKMDNTNKQQSGHDSAKTDNTSAPMQEDPFDANTVSAYISEEATEPIYTDYLDKRFSDLIINVAEKKINAHKVILVGKCNYFEKLLCPNGQPAQINEIKITDVSPAAFQLLLKYIYTGNPAVLSADTDLMLEMLNWTHKNSYSEAKTIIIEKLQSSLDTTNISAITNSANNNDLKDLLESCFMFLDQHSSEVLVSDSFEKFSQEALVKLLERKSFVASEIDIFNALVKWSKVNGNINHCIMKNDRLSRLTVLELLTVVRSSNLVNSERLLDIITQKFIPNSQLTEERKDEEESITVYVKNIKDILRINDTNACLVFKKCRTLPSVIVYHKLDDTNGLIFKLESPKKINHIKMTLDVQDSENCYSYYIEVSLDEIKWKKVIDYTKYLCRADQELYFNEEIIQYIRIVGTASDKDTVMSVSFFEALYKKTVPEIVNGVIRPTQNVCTQARTARFESEYRNSPFCLFENNNDALTYVKVNSKNNILIQLAQPYLISNIGFRTHTHLYKYFIETSVNKIKWEMAFDSRNEKRRDWQTHHFTERPVVFIRITPTWTSSPFQNFQNFYLAYFKCPAAIS